MRNVRRFSGLLALVAVLAVSAFVAAASANVGFGTALYYGSACSGCEVQVYNATTGSYGSTIANDSGGYSFSLNNADQYDFRVNSCSVYQFLIRSSWVGPIFGYVQNLPTLHAVNVSGTCYQ